MIDDLKVAISEGDKAKARSILMKDYLNTSYPYEVIIDGVSLAEEYNIFDPHNNEKLIEDPKKWTEEYFQDLILKLDKNFSKERFMKAYNVKIKLDKDKSKEENCPVEVSKNYKDFFLMAQVGAALLGAAVVGVGILCYKKGKKKK